MKFSFSDTFSRIKYLFGVKGFIWVMIPILISLFSIRFEIVTKKNERISNTFKRYEYYLSNIRIDYHDIVGVKNNDKDQESTRLKFLSVIKNSLFTQFTKTSESNLYTLVCENDGLRFPSPLYIPGVSVDLNDSGYIDNQSYLFETSLNKLSQYLLFYDQLGHMMRQGDFVDESLADILFQNDFWYISNKYFVSVHRVVIGGIKSRKDRVVYFENRI